VATAAPRYSQALGTLLGAAGGVGAVLLPERLGLGRHPVRRTARTGLMTVAWYTAGGAIAGAVYQRLSQTGS
jgi:hypothetical protein